MSSSICRVQLWVPFRPPCPTPDAQGVAQLPQIPALTGSLPERQEPVDAEHLSTDLILHSTLGSTLLPQKRQWMSCTTRGKCHTTEPPSGLARLGSTPQVYTRMPWEKLTALNTLLPAWISGPINSNDPNSGPAALLLPDNTFHRKFKQVPRF